MKINFRVLVSILAIPSFIYAITYLHLHSRYFITGDEAEYLNNAWRTYTGDKPYKDFWLLFPPGEVYWPTLIFHLFGINLNLILLSNILVTIFVALVVYLILRQLKCSPLYTLVATFLFITQGYFLFFMLLCLLSCYFLLRYASEDKKAFLLVSGFIAGLALLFRIYQVAPYCIAGFCFLFMGTKPIWQKIKDNLLFVGMASIPVIITVLLLWDIKSTMFYALVIDAVSHGTSMNIPYWHKMTEAWDKFLIYLDYSRTNSKLYPFKGAFIMCSNFLFDLFERASPFIVAICLLYDIISKSFKNHFAHVKIMFVIWGILYSPYALNLSGHEHIIQAYTPFLLLIYLYGYELFSYGRTVLVRGVMIFFFAIIIFNAATKLYEIYRPSYLSYKLTTPTSTLYSKDGDTDGTMKGILNSIEENTDEGEYIFSLAWDTPPLYALTERRDPTYYDSPIDLLIRPTRWKEQSIINALERTRTKLIVVETNFPFKGNINTNHTLPVLMNYINANYNICKHFPPYDIYLLK